MLARPLEVDTAHTRRDCSHMQRIAFREAHPHNKRDFSQTPPTVKEISKQNEIDNADSPFPQSPCLKGNREKKVHLFKVTKCLHVQRINKVV